MKYLLLLCAWIFVTPLSAAEESHAGFFDQTWGNLQEELETAKQAEKKALFLFFEMDECPFCRRMKQTIFSQPEIQTYYHQRFAIFPIDIEGDTELTDFQGNVTTSKEFAQKQHRVRATPVMIFFGLDGQQLYRHTGPTRDADEFKLMADYVVEGHYQTMPFSKYRQQQRAGQ